MKNLEEKKFLEKISSFSNIERNFFSILLIFFDGPVKTPPYASKGRVE